MRRVAERLCGVTDFELQTRERCIGLEVMHPRYFFPYVFEDRYKLLQDKETGYMLNKLNDAVGIHTWLSVRERVKYNGTNEPNSAYSVLGRQQCPRSFSVGGNLF